MNAYTHTQKCDIERAQAQERLTAFALAHPRYCRPCGGAGGFATRETRDEPSMWEACEVCIGNGNCPLCGAPLAEMDWEGDGPCPACGWARESGFPVAPEWECECYLTDDLYPSEADRALEADMLAEKAVDDHV